MLSISQKKLLHGLFKTLVPIARVLMRAGICHREFAEVSKMAFTHVAGSDYGIRGRPTNSSRIAVITGLSRKEVSRIRLLRPEDVEENMPVAPAAEVLHRWNTDPDYLDADQNPVPLPFKSDQVSFARLVSISVGDIPAGAVRTELLRVGAIRESDHGLLSIEKRYFVPERYDDKLQHGFDVALRYLGETLAFNTDQKMEGKPRFERVVSSVGIPIEKFDQIERESRAMLARYTEEYDDMLSRHEIRRADKVTAGEIGVGLYFFRSED